jgi:hypothetical protein
LIFSQATFAYNCWDYAYRAIKQNNAAQSLYCGYQGNRWLANWQAHFDWCMSVPQSAALVEDNARKYALRNCINRPSYIYRCHHYSSKAVMQNKANLALSCGFSGPRWQSNYYNHKNWCDAVADRSRPGFEDRERKRYLIACVYR